jgi:hypothetical protein
VQKRLAKYLQINRKGQQHCGHLLENQTSGLDNAYAGLQLNASTQIVDYVPKSKIWRTLKCMRYAKTI